MSGKARVINQLSENYDWVIRFSGGPNAGHTLYYNDLKIVRNMLPSTDFSKKWTKSLLTSNMVLEPNDLLDEIKASETLFPGCSKRIYIDPEATVILPEHKQEDRNQNKHIGTTGKGITPAYLSKYNRCATRILDLIKNKHEAIVAMQELGVNFKYVNELGLKNDRCLFEGAQGLLLNIHYGTYPFVTSSDTGIGGIYNSGIAVKLDEVLAVSKIYSTRVGEGVYPTEIFGQEAEDLRKLGNEYGAVTGRPRRVGYLDLPALNYAKIKSGLTSIALTKLDIVSSMKSIKVCTSYSNLPGGRIDPACSEDFFVAKPNYTTVDILQDKDPKIAFKAVFDLIYKVTGLKTKYITNGVNPPDFFELK